MSKWYEVEVQVLIVYAVEVNDSENEVHARDAAYEDYKGAGRVSTSAQPLPAQHIATIRKNADKVLPLDDGAMPDGWENDDD